MVRKTEISDIYNHCLKDDEIYKYGGAHIPSILRLVNL